MEGTFPYDHRSGSLLTVMELLLVIRAYWVWVAFSFEQPRRRQSRKLRWPKSRSSTFAWRFLITTPFTKISGKRGSTGVR